MNVYRGKVPNDFLAALIEGDVHRLLTSLRRRLCKRAAQCRLSRSGIPVIIVVDPRKMPP
jgi:hypothetical protein